MMKANATYSMVDKNSYNNGINTICTICKCECKCKYELKQQIHIINHCPRLVMWRENKNTNEIEEKKNKNKTNNNADNKNKTYDDDNCNDHYHIEQHYDN